MVDTVDAVRWRSSPGCSVLVRPELALIGGLALVMMLVAARGWRRRLLIVVAGGLLPVAYQIFRMGYYGLLVPGTAMAKDASGPSGRRVSSIWPTSTGPTLLWVPAAAARGAGGARAADLRGRPWWIARSRRAGLRRAARDVQSPPAVVVFIVVSGLLQALYWIRQGGDFMHGRVLLTPLFCLLAPGRGHSGRAAGRRAGSRGRPGYLLAGATSGCGWPSSAGRCGRPTRPAWARRHPRDLLRHRRRTPVLRPGHRPRAPAHRRRLSRLPADARGADAIDNTPDGALLLPSGNYDQWDVVPAIPPPPPAAGSAAGPATEIGPHTVFFTNLGMLGMNVGLDVRVIDQIGLANPLAAHTARLEDGRIGHDKNLFPDWAVAEGPFLKSTPYIPPYLDEDWIAQARGGAEMPGTTELDR